ncbi:MAG: PAS domain S-box protein [Flexistipes sinusarabici]|uniref:PAS domain S-box protein n=1 Tax=Flexistipes sinusarabici TaxID=2352 RepID=A0A5D0MVF0_FLESI|nr:PAS domain-containing protein [Flexistipes sinusarabici]TYB36005.1 MAG: PAS domain S-box protein [Flexistipes sinusarabici]
MEKRVLEEFLEEAPDIILTVDRKGVIVYWNKSAEEIFGYVKKEAEGNSLDIIIPEKLQQRHWEGFNKVMETGKSKYSKRDMLSVPAITKSGDKIFIEFTITMVKDNDGNIEYCFAVIREKPKK